MKRIFLILAIVFAFSLSACTSDNDFEKAKKQLTQQGYTEIKDTGYSWFCCGEDDSFSTGFSAIDPEGNKVEGCICSGLLKGLTIRFK